MLYHFTDTARLRWILQSVELRPGANRIGGYPHPDFLWATADVRGSRTASASGYYRSGATRLVRFTLRPEDFEPWHSIVKRFPAWTPDQIARLEHAARGRDQPALWHCRAEPLPRAHWVEIATRGYTDQGWQKLALDTYPLRRGVDLLGVVINKKLY